MSYSSETGEKPYFGPDFRPFDPNVGLDNFYCGFYLY